VPDRGASLFSAHVAALAGDVMAVSAERDVRFNVRPEILGPVAVTIERRDDGAALRLGVENATTAQVVRQAEPVLSDAAARAGSPFIQISVDVQSSGQRDRPARVAAIMKRSGDVSLPEIEQAAVKSGRFA
jgi:flagellar hook-length control protein FliK